MGRSAQAGWSADSIRSNLRFLHSVDERALSGSGFACTLTVKTCPPSHEDWKRLREAFFARLRRAGLIRLHWVTEWQERGVPHLHLAAYFPPLPTDEWATMLATDAAWTDYSRAMIAAGEEIDGTLRLIEVRALRIVDTWVDTAAAFDAHALGQHVVPIHDTVGWLKYVAKHAGRGLSHYQRGPEGTPRGWRKTGRMWGRIGEWETQEAIRITLTDEAWHRYRRTLRGIAKGTASRTGNHVATKQAGRMLRANTRELAEIRGTRAWLPIADQLRILDWLASEGHDIRHTGDDAPPAPRPAERGGERGARAGPAGRGAPLPSDDDPDDHRGELAG